MSKTSVFMFLTRSCNLACSHCYVSAGPRLKERMSLEIFRRIVDVLSSQGIDDFRLTGGEPTIHPEFNEMLDLLNSKQISPRLITNGVRLMQMRSPQSVLNKINRCWISTYGLSNAQHRSIGGERSRSLEDILDFAGRQTKAGYWVGVSALLTEVRFEEVENFVALAKKHDLRYLRFLFCEPSGRAVASQVAFDHGSGVRDQARTVVDFLRRSCSPKEFEFLSINNPFDLDSTTERHSSCLLEARRMWSISPEGDIYSCCFNVYDPAHLVTNIQDDDVTAKMIHSGLAEVYAPRCKGLTPGFWGTSPGATTCPISALELSDHN